MPNLLAPLLLLLPLIPPIHAYSFSNQKYAASLLSSAITLPRGKYKFTNAGTGAVLTFLPFASVPNVIMSSASSIKSSPKSLDTTIQVTSLGGKQIRLAVTDDGGQLKCFSAQWDYKIEGGCDHAATIYACCRNKKCDNGSDDGPLRWAKQAWLIVPASSPSVHAAAVAGPRRMMLKARSADDESEPEVEGEGEGGGNGEGQEEVEEGGIEKRAASTKYYIIPVDHVYDMKTRAFVGATKKTAGSQTSIIMSQLNDRDPRQQWYITRE